MELLKDKDLYVSMHCPYPYDMIGVFSWLSNVMDKWNRNGGMCGHPKVSARIISQQSDGGKSQITIQMFADAKIILSDNLLYNGEDNFFIEYSKFSARVMNTIMQFGISNLVLLTPINKN